MTQDQIVQIAKEVYGQDTEWRGATLMRLELLAKRLIEADRLHRAQMDKVSPHEPADKD